MNETPGIDSDKAGSLIFDTLGVPAESPWYVAFSGGLDSTVLVHLLAAVCRSAELRLVALHADHGLHERSPDWRRHCEDQCRSWGVELRATRLAIPCGGSLGPEGEARAARYRWFAETAGRDAWLFTAHHRGDQAETVIERLVRGSGPRGMRGILPVARVCGLHVARPLRETPRAALRRYAEVHRLTWVEDESNRDPRFTRSYIRTRVLPVLKERWPRIESALARTASVMADAQQALDQYADAELQRLDERPVGGDPSLDIAGLKSLTAAQQRNVLRAWIDRELGVSPGYRRLNRMVLAVARSPEPFGGMTWPPIDLRIHRGRLYLATPLEPPAEPQSWSMQRDLEVGARMRLRARQATGRGLKAALVENGVTVGFRRGGEKCRLPGRRHRHLVKKVLQEAGVPPWQRSRIPLIRVNDDIAAIAGVTCCDPYAAGEGEPGVDVEVVYR